jgi:hypothetical protein
MASFSLAEVDYMKSADENVMARKFLKIGRYKTRT